jgi:hypothetical protein
MAKPKKPTWRPQKAPSLPGQRREYAGKRTDQQQLPENLPQRSMVQMPNIDFLGTLNPQAFEALIAATGSKFPMKISHALPCPRVRSVQGGDHDPNCDHCYNGYTYYDTREFTGVLMGNGLQRGFQMQGSWDVDQAQIVIPTKDLNGNDLRPAHFDQIQIQEEITFYQRVEHSQTGVDRLHFPALEILRIDSASGRQFTPGVDYVINPFGRIEWRTTNRPGYDLNTDLGEVYSVAYKMKPVYTVIDIPLYTNIGQTQSAAGAGSENVTARFPYVVTVRRDFIPHTTGDAEGDSDPQPPRDGSV